MQASFPRPQLLNKSVDVETIVNAARHRFITERSKPIYQRPIVRQSPEPCPTRLRRILEPSLRYQP
jgi:hypothetical protein